MIRPREGVRHDGLRLAVLDKKKAKLLAVRHDRSVHIEHVARPVESHPAIPPRDKIKRIKVMRSSASTGSEGSGLN